MSLGRIWSAQTRSLDIDNACRSSIRRCAGPRQEQHHNPKQREFARSIPHSRIEVIRAGHELPSLAPDRVIAAIESVFIAQPKAGQMQE